MARQQDVMRGAHGAQGVIGLQVGGVPEREDGIAHELVEGAFLFEHGVRGEGEIGVEDFEDHFRVLFFAVGGEPAQVGEEDGDGFLGPVETQVARVGQQAVADAWGHDLAKGLADALLFGFQMAALGHIFKEDGRAFGFAIGVEQWRARDAQCQFAALRDEAGDFGDVNRRRHFAWRCW